MRIVQRSVLPGFNITMGFTITYLCLIVLIPLSGLFVVTSGTSFGEIKEIMSNLLVKRAFILTFRSSLIAAVVNAFFGLVVAWSLVRYRFIGRRFIDAMVDLPFALPTAVSGIALARIYSDSGWLGRGFTENGCVTRLFHSFGSALSATGLPYMADWGEKILACSTFPIRNTEFGVTLALIFIGLPFVIRTLQPAIEEIDRETEEASASLGASRWQTFWRVLFPSLLPAHISGFAMAFARALGEYGTVIFIGGSLPGKTQTISYVIYEKAEENNLVAASVVAVVTLILSFVILLLINLVQVWANKRCVKAD
ncbi:MAG: ABC transporter permease subunit [Thermoguttaceae bacterium]|nr:ABC transporter permease subunit [Thermoguttaceae bacterium]MBR4752380.1 ABC transporter permease subunit [Thermoguttaceae bacterium]MBR5758871.1 ABC transporter permease subunit [Thermoguttaceae bacterium]